MDNQMQKRHYIAGHADTAGLPADKLPAGIVVTQVYCNSIGCIASLCVSLSLSTATHEFLLFSCIVGLWLITVSLFVFIREKSSTTQDR